MAFGLAAVWLVAGVGAAVPSERGPKTEVVYVSGAPETKQTAAGAEVRWWRGKVVIEIDSSVDQLGPGAREAVQMGFGAWLGSGAKLPDLGFDTGDGAEVSLKPDGRSSVIYAPIELPGQKQSLAVTISHIDAETGEIVEADLVINAKKPFAILAGDAVESEGDSGCGGQYDVQNVVTHEVGHFFGLDEDEVEPGTTMFFKTGKCELQKRDLSGQDTAVMAGLYAQPVEDREQGAASGCAMAVRQPPGRGARTSGTWGMVGVLLALGLLRRSPRKDPG